MAELSTTNPAHVSVFMFLSINGQSTRPLAAAGATPGMGTQAMKDLTFFNGAASADMRAANAAVIAHMLIVFIHTYYTQQREKAFDETSTWEIVAKIAALLVTPAKTVHDLATLADSIYRFSSEATAAVPLGEVARTVGGGGNQQ